MAHLFADENFPRPVVEELRAAGHDVVTIQEIGEAGRSVANEVVLARATADGRAVLTLNRRHFILLHRAQPEHGGIIVCTFDTDFSRQAARIDAALRGVPSLTGQILRINRPDR